MQRQSYGEYKDYATTCIGGKKRRLMPLTGGQESSHANQTTTGTQAASQQTPDVSTVPRFCIEPTVTIDSPVCHLAADGVPKPSVAHPTIHQTLPAERSPSIESSRDNKIRKRVLQACDRCVLKKYKVSPPPLLCLVPQLTQNSAMAPARAAAARPITPSASSANARSTNTRVKQMLHRV